MKEGAQDDRYEGCSTLCEGADSTGLSLATSKGIPSTPCILSLGWGLVGDTKGVWPGKRGWLGGLCFSIICKLACIYTVLCNDSHLPQPFDLPANPCSVHLTDVIIIVMIIVIISNN